MIHVDASRRPAVATLTAATVTPDPPFLNQAEYLINSETLNFQPDHLLDAFPLIVRVSFYLYITL